MGNKIEEVAKLLGVELGEKFNIVVSYNNDKIEGPFLLKEDGLYRGSSRCDVWLVDGAM